MHISRSDAGSTNAKKPKTKQQQNSTRSSASSQVFCVKTSSLGCKSSPETLVRSKISWTNRCRAHQDGRISNCINQWATCSMQYKGGPNSISKNHISFRCQKRTQKLVTKSLLPACLDHDNLSLSVMLMKEVPFPKPAIEALFEARRGLAEATPRTQNVLAQEQSEAHGDSKLYNTIVEVPARLNLK